MIGVFRVEIADDHVEFARLVLIQTRLIVLWRRLVVKEHGSPFDVKDAIRRTAGDRGEDTACSTRETRAAGQTGVGALVLPQREDGVVKRAIEGSRREALIKLVVSARLVNAHEVETSIGANVDSVKALAAEREGERQRDERIAVIGVKTCVGVTGYDGIGASGDRVLATAGRWRGRCRGGRSCRWRAGRCRRWSWSRALHSIMNNQREVLIQRSAVSRHAVAGDVRRDDSNLEAAANACRDKDTLGVVANICRASGSGKGAGEHVS